MNHYFTIDQSLCTSCGECVQECGRHIPMPHLASVNPDNQKCIRCFHCFAVCPNNAIKINGLETAESSYRETLLHSVNKENLEHFLAYRRSHRRFENKEVDHKIITELIDSARYIPSGGNRHSNEFTVIRSETAKRELMQQLEKIYRMRSRIINNPVLRNLVKPFVNKSMRGFLNDPGYRARMKTLIDRIFNGDDPLFYNAPVIIMIHSREQIPTPKEDSILAGYNIVLMAQALGLGSCFVTLAQNAINASNKCKRLLNLSPEDNVNAVIVLGYPSVSYLRIAPRVKKQIKWL